MTRILLVILMVVGLAACNEDEGPPQYKPKILFERDGCTVYKFQGHPEWGNEENNPDDTVYFTKCGGASSSVSWTTVTGVKVRRYHRHQVVTNYGPGV